MSSVFARVSRTVAHYLPVVAILELGLGWSSAIGGDAVSSALLWDTQRAAESGEVDFGRRAEWKRVPPGTTSHSFSGDAVIENERIMVAFCRCSGGPVVGPKSTYAQARDRSRLVPLAAGRQPANRLQQIRIRENEDDEIVLEVTAGTETGGEIRAAYSLSRGQAFVECKPLGNADRIRVEAATRYAVIPDFFGADMIFDPRAYSQANLTIPPENFVLDLLEGENTIVMSVWPTADQDAELVLAGTNEERRIHATEITFGGKSVYVAVLHGKGIWHAYRLPESYVDQDLELGWNRPFPAKWRANFCCQRRNDSWDFQDHKSSTWMYLYQAIVWPCWFEREAGFVRLSRQFIRAKGPIESVLVYPGDRHKNTPLAVLTPVDIVRNTLGVGPCEYVLDREGLLGRSANTGRKNFGRGVCDTTTPIEYLFMEGLETRERALVCHLVDDILADIRAIHGRILEFRRFGEDLAKLGSTLPRNSAGGTQLCEEIQKNAREIESLYQEKLRIIKNPASAEQVGRRINELAARSDPENLGECKTLTRELRDVAGTQHRMVGDYRVKVKRLRQEAGICGAEDPAAAKAAEKVRKLAGVVLRKKFGVEAD